MAERGFKHAAHRLFAAAPPPSTVGEEFDEADVWGYAPAVEHRKPAVIGRRKSENCSRERGSYGGGGGAAATTVTSSLPVNIPDWAKILRQEYRGQSRSWEEEEEEAEEGYGVVIPPHELLCRSRTASLSVHEGVGRTLKGRDLSRVRNAIWEKTGFQD